MTFSRSGRLILEQKVTQSHRDQRAHHRRVKPKLSYNCVITEKSRVTEEALL